MPTSDEKKQGKPLNKTTKEIPHANFFGLVDIVIHGEDTAFLMSNPDGKLYIEKKVDYLTKNKILIPPKRNQIPFSLLNSDSVLECSYDINCLYHDIVGKLKDVSKLPGESYYHLCAVYIFFTYLSQAAYYYPYLWFYGLPERGKSRMVKVMARLAHRGFYTETLNQGPLFRISDNFAGTIILDVFEIVRTAKNRGAYDILLGRFEEGFKLPRVTNIDKGPFQDMTYYQLAGPTIIATNVTISNRDPLRSRCIQIIMPEARGRYRNIDPDKELMPLKAGLLRFRAQYMHQPLPDVEKPAAGRLGDLMQPICATAKLLPKEASQNLYKLIDEIQSARKDAEAESFPGQIAEVLWTRQLKARAEKLKVAEICRALNENRPEKYHVDSQEVGSTLAAMSIERRKKGGGVMHIIWNEEIMQNLFDRFGINEETVPLLSPASLTPKRLEVKGTCSGETARDPDQAPSESPQPNPANNGEKGE